MAFDAFIKIDGIEGESTDDKHPGWIEALYYKNYINQSISTTASSAGGASVERADFGDFIFTKQLDKASPQLALACASGDHINRIVIELCRAGAEKLKFMEYRLTNCLISDVTTGGSEKIFPAETFKINFGKIEWSYTQQKRQGGGPAGNVVCGWSLEKNCKV